MLTRILTGVLLAPLVALLLLEGPDWGVQTLFVVASAICLNELYAMAMPAHRVERWLGVLLGVGLQIALIVDPHVNAATVTALWLGSALLVLARPKPIEQAMLRLSTVWAGFAYVVLPFTFGLMLAVEPSRMAMVLLLSIVWAGDTFAYFGGKAFGRHKLYPTVSPKKTVEGAICGLVGSVLLAVVIASAAIPGLSPLKAAVLGLLCGAVAQIGDLVASLIKRSCGVKDSGALLPGHGGMLDRIDGVIAAFPVMYALL